MAEIELAAQSRSRKPVSFVLTVQILVFFLVFFDLYKIYFII